MASHWSLFALAAVLTGCLGDMSVDTLSVLYLPYAYNPRPKHELFSAAVEQIGFDPKTQMVYTIGRPSFTKPCSAKFNHLLSVYLILFVHARSAILSLNCTDGHMIRRPHMIGGNS